LWAGSCASLPNGANGFNPTGYTVPMTDAAPKAMSEAEYLRTEAQSPYKREYVGGFVYPLHAQA
jgi:hypothetical protein